MHSPILALSCMSLRLVYREDLFPAFEQDRAIGATGNTETATSIF